MAAVLSIALMAAPLGATQKRSKKKRPSQSVTRTRSKPPSQAAVRVRRRATVTASVLQSATLSYITHRREYGAEHAEGSIENAAGLVPFFEQISHPPLNKALHVLQYGDSHTASDDWANTMRQDLQSRFGSGGAGFAFAGHPYRGYRRFDVSGTGSSGWYSEGLAGHPGDGIYGLGGVSITAQSGGETVSLSAECEELQLFYLQQRGGGQLEFSVDGSPVETISTDGSLAPGYFKYNPGPGPHRFLLRTLSSAPVRLFGWAADKQNGITWETLGINGASATMLVDWNESILASHIARRDPALIVLAYGTNEALSPRWTSENYRAAFTEVIERFRRAAPTASILVVGPPDCQMRVGHRFASYPQLDQVTEIQREVAYQHGCAFWDWRARMGGRGAVQEWVTAGLAQPDHVHLTTTGYHMLGKILVDEIMQQYTRFLAVRTE